MLLEFFPPSQTILSHDYLWMMFKKAVGFFFFLFSGGEPGKGVQNLKKSTKTSAGPDPESFFHNSKIRKALKKSKSFFQNSFAETCLM